MGEGIPDLSTEGFARDVLASAEPVLVDFWAPWCKPCLKIAPHVEELGRRYAGRLRVAKLDIDAHPGPASRYDVLSIPTLILFRGGEPVARVVGAVRPGKLERTIAPFLETD